MNINMPHMVTCCSGMSGPTGVLHQFTHLHFSISLSLYFSTFLANFGKQFTQELKASETFTFPLCIL